MKLKVALLAMVAFGGAATAVYAADRLEPSRVSALLNARLPKTQVSAIDCDKVAGLCEVVAGKTLFYVDGSARYLIVGRVYDMETRQDLKERSEERSVGQECVSKCRYRWSTYL